MLTREQRDRRNAKAREKDALAALAAGRVPGRHGQPPKNRTDEEKRLMHNARVKKYRDEHLEKMRAYKAEWERQNAARKAIDAGRLPGKSGKPKVIVTEEERKARQNARVKRYYHENKEKMRAVAAKREREKRAAIKAGTYNPQSNKRMPDEHHAAVEKAAAHARRARMKNGGKGPRVADLRKLRYRQNGLCDVCHMQLGTHDIHLDHWVPLKLDGTNDFDNLRLLHGVCNLKKGASHPRELGLAA